jgi:hypothetical protein
MWILGRLIVANGQSIGARWGDYRPTKTLLFWACAACVVATMIVGFGWGGWVTGGTAAKMAKQSATEARAQLTAAICVDRFVKAPDASAQLASLKSTDAWKRDAFIEKGGWVTLAGMQEPVEGAADLCADKLIEAKIPAASTKG